MRPTRLCVLLLTFLTTATNVGLCGWKEIAYADTRRAEILKDPFHVRSLCFTADGTAVCVGYRDGVVEIYDLDKRRAKRFRAAHSGDDVVGIFLLNEMSDFFIVRSDYQNPMRRNEWRSSSMPVPERISESAWTASILSAADMKSRDLSKGDHWLQGLSEHRESGIVVACSNPQPVMTWEPEKGTVVVMDRETGEIRKDFSLNGQGNVSAISHDGTKIAVGTDRNGKVYVLDIKNGRLLASVVLRDAEHVKGIAFSTDDKTCTILSNDLNQAKASLFRCDIDPPRVRIRKRYELSNGTYRMCLSGDDEIALACYEHVEVGPIDGQREILPCGESALVLAVTFSDDRQLLAAGTAKGTIRVWRRD